MSNVHNLHGDEEPDTGGVDTGGQSIEELNAARERVAAEEAERQRLQEEEDGQFALEIPDTGRKITLGTLIPRGVPIEHKYKTKGKPIPNVKGGLMDPSDTSGLLLATRVVEKVVVSFTRDADLNIEKAIVETHLGLRTVVNAHSEAGGLLMSGDAEAA